jgi:hypothetical protein
MGLGPVQYIVIKFEGNRFTGEIAPALAEVVTREVIRIIDITFVQKDRNGNVRVMELNEIDADALVVFDPLVDEITGLLSSEDVERLSEALENNSSAAIMLIELTWATRLRDALVNSGGILVAEGIIPREVVEQVSAEIARTNT